MTLQATATTSNQSINPAFEKSWQLLISSGRKIIELSESNQWQQAGILSRHREKLSNRHFLRYPVGPKFKSQYQHRLSELFQIEQHLENLSTIKPSNHTPPAVKLQLVR